MLSSVVPSALALALALLVLASGITAHKFDWVDTLPDCWQNCLGKTSDGCHSSNCICDASQSNSYLPTAISCATAACEAQEWVLELSFLLPLQAYCGAAGNAVPDEVMSSAYAAASATSTPTPDPVTSRRVEHSQKPSDQKSTKHGDDQLTEVFTSTMTKTTTNEDGQTLQIIVPVVMGPNTMSFGKTVTSTLEGQPSATDSPTSAAASPSPTAGAPAPASTPAEQQPQAASSTSSPPPQRTSNSNGSPFENMQAGAGRWGVSGLLVGMGAVAGVFMRL